VKKTSKVKKQIPFKNVFAIIICSYLEINASCRSGSILTPTPLPVKSAKRNGG
jgi:hypothetical protein